MEISAVSAQEFISLTMTENNVVLPGHTSGLPIAILLIESELNQLKVVPPNASN